MSLKPKEVSSTILPKYLYCDVVSSDCGHCSSRQQLASSGQKSEISEQTRVGETKKSLSLPQHQAGVEQPKKRRQEREEGEGGS